LESVLRRRRSNKLLELTKRKQLFSTKSVSYKSSSSEQYDSDKDKDYVHLNWCPLISKFVLKSIISDYMPINYFLFFNN